MFTGLDMFATKGFGSQMRWPLPFTYVCVSIFVFLPPDKKCTYGLKCKFYHPERTNQSYLSLADELREKAQISTEKEERNARLSPRHLQSDPGPAPNVCSFPEGYNTEHIRDGQCYSHPGLVSENALLCWEDPRKHTLFAVKGNQCQKELPGLHFIPNHYYSNMSHEYLDSGFGSYESQYSDLSHCLGNSHVLKSQQQSPHAGHRHASGHPDKKKTGQPCGCCSNVGQQQRRGKPDGEGRPNCGGYPPQMFTPGGRPQHRLPNQLHYGGGPHHQQNYWPDPFLGCPQARTSSSLPSAAQNPHPHNSYCSHKGHHYHSWGQQQSPSAAFDPERLELRKKLHAIFNPFQVDRVMEMFPHLMDAERLAAEILNLRASSGILGWFSLFQSSSARANMILALTHCQSN